MIRAKVCCGGVKLGVPRYLVPGSNAGSPSKTSTDFEPDAAVDGTGEAVQMKLARNRLKTESR